MPAVVAATPELELEPPVHEYLPLPVAPLPVSAMQPEGLVGVPPTLHLASV